MDGWSHRSFVEWVEHWSELKDFENGAVWLSQKENPYIKEWDPQAAQLMENAISAIRALGTYCATRSEIEWKTPVQR